MIDGEVVIAAFLFVYVCVLWMFAKKATRERLERGTIAIVAFNKREMEARIEKLRAKATK